MYYFTTPSRFIGQHSLPVRVLALGLIKPLFQVLGAFEPGPRSENSPIYFNQIVKLLHQSLFYPDLLPVVDTSQRSILHG